METQESTTDSEKNCLIVIEDLANAGTFVEQAEARTRLDDYFRETHQDPSTEGFVFGQTFGLNKFRDFLGKIDEYNRENLNDEKRICGIRIYDGMSKRPYLLPPRNEVFLPDAVLMPVLKNGKDLYTIHDLVDPVIILTGGRPCPNECGTSFF